MKGKFFSKRAKEAIFAGLMQQKQIDVSIRLLFADDRLFDAAWDIIRYAGNHAENIQGMRFSSNEGHQNVLLAFKKCAGCFV